MKQFDIDDLIDISDLIGVNEQAFDCEFHEDEKSASIIDNKYSCSCCGIQLNSSQYLSQSKGISRWEALAFLYRMKRLPIPGFVVEHVKPSIELIKINNEITAMCSAALQDNNEAALNAMDYLKSTRKLSDETIAKFKLGFFPKDKDFLQKLIRNFGKEKLLQLGVVMEGEYGDFSIYKNRIIFPITNNLQQICGFGSRRLDGVKKNKYINSPQSILFNKSELLYTSNNRAHGHGVITEGYMDVIACTQHDDTNKYYAALGVALTSKHVRDVLKMHSQAIICTDADKAGIEATKRFIQNDLKNVDIDRVGFVILDDGMDPDEYIQKYGIDSFKEKINSPISAKSFISNSLQKQDLLHVLESYDQFKL